MAIDRYYLDSPTDQPLDDGSAAPVVPVVPSLSQGQDLSTPAAAPIVPTTAATIAAPSVTAPAPEPPSWSQIWDQLGTPMPAEVRQVVESTPTPSLTPTPAPAPAPLPSLPDPVATPPPLTRGPIDNSSKQAFVRSAFPYMLDAADGNRDAAEMMLAAAISENGDVGTGKPFFGNNFFGIKGKGDAGSVAADTWEDYGNGRVNIRDNFAAYSSPVAGFRAFFDFLHNNSRYAGALQTYTQTGDAERLFHDVNIEGYATDKQWADKVANIRRNQVAPVVAGIASGTPQPMPTNPPAETLDINDIAHRYAGGSYVFGGGRDGKGYGIPGDPDSDCSAFVSAVWGEHGIPLLAHTDGAYNQLRQLGASQVSSTEARPGDVVFYMGAGTGGAITHHMGIYAGIGPDGKAKVLDQSVSGGTSGVMIRDLTHGGNQIVIMRDPRMSGTATTGTAYRPPSIVPIGVAEGATSTPDAIPDRVAAPTFLEQLNQMTEDARRISEQTSGRARQLVDDAVTGVSSLANQATSNLGSTLNAAYNDPLLAISPGRALVRGRQELTDLSQGLTPGTTALQDATPIEGENPLRAIGRTYSTAASSATLGLMQGVAGFVEGGLNAAGLDDTSLANTFEQSRQHFEQLQQNDPRFKSKDIDFWNSATYTDPTTYSTIAGQVYPSVLASIATGGMSAAVLGRVGTAPLISALPQIGTRASVAGSVAFNLPTAAGMTIPELKKLGASDQEAFVGGVISGLLQSALEAVNPIDNAPGAFGRFLSESASSGPFLQRLLGASKDFVVTAGKEGFEEGSQQFADNIVQKWFGSDKGWFDQVFENTIVGAISGGGMGAPGAAIRLAAGHAQQSPQVAPGAPQIPDVAPTSPGLENAPGPASVQEQPIDLGMEPVARDRPAERLGSVEDAARALPLPIHRIGDVSSNGVETEGALALAPERSNSTRPASNDLPEDLNVDGYRLVGGPMRHGEDTRVLIEGSARVPGTDVSVMGQRGETDQGFLDQIANRPYIAALTSIVRQLHDQMQQHLMNTTPMEGTKPSVFAEWLLGPNLLGSNAQNPNADHNRIGVGLHETLHEVMLEAQQDGIPVGSPKFYTRVAEHVMTTLAHEIVHNKYPDPEHKDKRRIALTDMLADAAINPRVLEAVSAAVQRGLGDTGLSNWHEDYVAVRERAQRGAATAVDDTRPDGDLLAADEGRNGDGGLGRGPVVSPGLRPVPPGARAGSNGDLESSPPVPPVGPEPARARGLEPLDPLEVTELLNDYHDSAAKQSASDRQVTLGLLRDMRAILTPENVEEAVDIAAVDYLNTDGTKPPSLDDAKKQLREELQRALPELFGGKAESEAKYEHGSTQVNIDDPLKSQIVKAARDNIWKKDRAGDGIEQTPHVTVRYGLGERATVDEVHARIGQMPPIEAKIGPVKAFTGGDTDVVYLSVIGDLAPLHEALADLDSEGFEQFEGGYSPHITLSYVKPGTGQAVANRLNTIKTIKGLIGTALPVTQVAVSDRNGDQELVELSGERPAVVEPEVAPETEQAPSVPEPELTPDTSEPAEAEPTTAPVEPAIVEPEAPSAEPEPNPLPDLGKIPGFGSLNLDRVPPAFRSLLEQKLKTLAASGKQYQDGFGDVEVRRAAESAGFKPDDPEYAARVEDLAKNIIGRDTAGRTVEIEILKRAIVESTLEQFDGLRDLDRQMSEQGPTPALLKEAEQHVQRIIDQQDLGLLALRRAGEEAGRSLRRMQLGLADAAELETLQRYNALTKQIDPVKRAVEAKVKALVEGTGTGAGPEISILIRNLQALEKMGALLDFRIKTDEGSYLPLSTLSSEDMKTMSQDDVMRAMSAASRAWDRAKAKLRQQSPEATRSAMAAGAQNGPSAAYQLGENLVLEQEFHGDDAAREDIYDERMAILKKLVQETLDEQSKKVAKEQQAGPTILSPEEIQLAVYEALGERAATRARVDAIREARAGEAIGPVASEIRDRRNTENMTLAASTAAASHLARGLARLEQRLGDNVVGNQVVDAVRAKVEAAVADLAFHPESDEHVARVYAAYQREADGEGQRFVDQALRVLKGEKYLGDTRVDPAQIAAVSDAGGIQGLAAVADASVARNLARAMSGVLTHPDELKPRTAFQNALGALRDPKYGAAGGRLADDLSSLLAMEDGRRIANEAINEAKKDPTNPEAAQAARDTIEQVRSLAESQTEPWLYQRFAPIAYTLDERLDTGIERSLERAAGQDAKEAFRRVVADPGDPDARQELHDLIGKTDPQTASDLQAMLSARLAPSTREAAAAGMDPTRTDATRRGAVDRLVERLKELDQIGRAEADPDLIRPLANEVLGMLDDLGEYGKQKADAQREKSRAAGLSRLRLRNADLSTQQWGQFLALARTGDPSTIGKAMRLVQDPSFASYVREWGVIAMLSSPTTWGLFGVNSVGNALNAGLMGALWFPQLGYDMAASVVPGREREIFASEALPALKAFGGGVVPGTREALEIMLWGNSRKAVDEAQMHGELRSLRTEWLTNTKVPLLSPPLNLAMQLMHAVSTRPLAALDAFYSHALYAAHLEARLQRRADRDGVSRAEIDPLDHPDIVREAGKLTDYTLLQSKSEKLQQIVHAFDLKSKQKADASPSMRVMLEFLDVLQFLAVPFKAVPLNQIKQGLDRSIVASPWHLGRLAETGLRADRVAAGQAAEQINARLPSDARVLTADDLLKRGREGYRDELSQVREQQAQRFSKLALGVGLLVLGVGEALAGHLTGDEPDDEDERRNWIQSKKEPRTWNPFGMLPVGLGYDNTPFAMQLSMAATAVQRSDAEYKKLVKGGMAPGAGTKATAYGIAGAKGVTSAIAHNFFLSNLMEMAQAVLDNRTDPAKAGASFAGEAVGRQVPNLLTYVARLGDDFERETKGEGAWDTFVNRALTQRVPEGWGGDVIRDRADLPVKLRPLGQPTESRYADDRPIVPGLPVVPGLTSWPTQNQDRYSSTASILNKYGLAIPGVPDSVSPTGALPINLTEQEKRIYQQAMGPELARRTTLVYNKFADPRYVNSQRSILGASPTNTNRFVEKRALQQFAIRPAQQHAMAEVIRSLGPDKQARAHALRGRMLEEFMQSTWEPDDEN